MRRLLDRLRFMRDHRWAPPRMSQYIDGDLDAPARARIERHADECPECDELLRSLRELVAALGRVRGDDGRLVADAVLATVQTRLREDS